MIEKICAWIRQMAADNCMCRTEVSSDGSSIVVKLMDGHFEADHEFLDFMMRVNFAPSSSYMVGGGASRYYTAEHVYSGFHPRGGAL